MLLIKCILYLGRFRLWYIVLLLVLYVVLFNCLLDGRVNI